MMQFYYPPRDGTERGAMCRKNLTVQLKYEF